MKFNRSLLPLLLPIGTVVIAAGALFGAFAQDVAPAAVDPATMSVAAVTPIIPPSTSQPPSAPENKPVVRAPEAGAGTPSPPLAPAVPAASDTATPPAPPVQAPAPEAPRFSSAELDQILAPIALYPDSLLSQILMASTYPLEIVEAARWVSVPANRALKGDALVAALRDKHWEPSIMALVAFPHVLEQLCAQLEWTQKLGNAFLAQQAEVMDSVQRLRRQAMAAGRFQSGPQCKCVVTTNEGGYVTVAPAEPRVVYQPVYDPLWVYGAWPYPLYPPVAFPVPVGFAYAPGFYFGYWRPVDVALYGPLWGWGSFAWGAHSIVLDPVRVGVITGGAVMLAGTTWVHDPAHRMSVAYAGTAVAARGGAPMIRGASAAMRGAVAGPRRFRGAAHGAFAAGPGRGFAGPRGAFAQGHGGGFHRGGPHGGRAHMAFAGPGRGFGGGGGHGGGGHGGGGHGGGGHGHGRH